MFSPLPSDEAARLDALRRYGSFGLLREAIFDDIARLAAYICQTPISLISLVDSTHQWFLSCTGFDACETSRDVSFCAHALVGTEMLVVEDALMDARFARNPLVTGDPHVRFYAGAPLLTSDGHALGTLCVIDHVPRQILTKQKELLQALSHLVMGQLDLNRVKRELSLLKGAHFKT